MRCGCIITHKERRSQAGVRMVIDKRSVESWWHTSDAGVFPDNPTMAQKLSEPNTSICGGKIVATVEAEDEPFFGGHSATLSITYKCDKCDNTIYPELPQTAEDLSKFLTAHIGDIEAGPLREKAKERELRERAEREAWIRESTASLNALKPRKQNVTKQLETKNTKS